MDKKEVEICGVGGQVTLIDKSFNSAVIISRKGGLDAITNGFSGNKVILLKNITDVQFKKSTSYINGYIHFSILGGNESTGGLISDENTIMFNLKQESNFKELKRYIDSVINNEKIEFSDLEIINTNNDISEKSRSTALILSFLVGYLGIDRFYLGNIGLGIGKLLTFGGFGIWSFIDFIYIALGKAKDSEGKKVINM